MGEDGSGGKGSAPACACGCCPGRRGEEVCFGDLGTTMGWWCGEGEEEGGGAVAAVGRGGGAGALLGRRTTRVGCSSSPIYLNVAVKRESICYLITLTEFSF